MESSGDDSIRVFVRVRPPDPNLDGDLYHAHCVDVTSATSLSVQSRPEPKVFTFDHVAGMQTTQEDVFSAIGRPIIESCMCGYNGTIFAYGQTGSGKTFTMIGPTQEDSDSDSFTHELRGIIPRGFEYLFSLINREIEKCGDLVEFLCKCSFLEIYNEQVFDLLDPASSGLHLRENMSRGVYVDGLTEQSIASARDAYQVLRTGWVNRRVASTSMNRESSRSHAVFTLTIESKKRETNESIAKIKTSLLNLVDLAGSERQRDTQTAGLRLKEAGSINKSLSALGNVIMALVDIAHGKSRHVHYRDSKLTFLLRDSLGGNAKTHLVANVHPSARCFGETLSTLNFARRAKMIRNKAVVNEDTSGTVQQLQSEIRRLKQLVEKLRSGMAASIPLPPTPEERGVALLPGSSPPLSSSSSSSSLSGRGVGVLSDDAKTIIDIKEMLTHSMAAREKSESTKMSLLERIENLQRLCDKKEKFLQSTKMILKFRETHIGNMEKQRRGKGGEEIQVTLERSRPGGTVNGLVSGDGLTTSALLKQEVEQLRYQVDHHPDVTKFALENLDLRAELKKLRSTLPGGSVHKELARTHQYTLQLERQLRHYLAKEAGAGSPVKVGGAAGLVPRLRPQARVTGDEGVQSSERLQSKLCGLQSELEKTRRQLATEREEFHLKEAQMEVSLNTAHKANQELERSIEALKLKSSVEKATLNDLHMNTIRSMLTPKKVAVQVSIKSAISSSPFRRVDSDPVRQSLDFTKPPGPLSPPPPSIPESPELECKGGVSGLVSSAHQSSSCVSVGTNTEITGDLPVEGGLNELNIEGALTDELKLLQDANRNLQSQLEELESTVYHLDRDKSDLSSQLVQLQSVSRSEHEASLAREQDLLEKVADMTVTVADLTSSNTVLKSEVVDLRVCLQSADRELSEAKTTRKQDSLKHNSKLMECMQKIGELEQVVATNVADLERQTEDLQNMQDEVETGREELTFKSHRINDLEQALRQEKEHSTSLTAEMQCVLEKLTREVEKNTQLSSELQEGENGKQQELVKALDENAMLSSRVTQLETDMKRQLHEYQRQTSDAQTTITSLHNRQMADREAIGSLMGQLQELRSSRATEEARVGSLRRELQDTSQELRESLSRNNRQAAKVESLEAQIKNMVLDHERELKKKDSEREIVVEELEHISEQYQQLSSTFAAQSEELSLVERETRETRQTLALRETELATLRQKKERRASVSKAQSFDEMKTLLEQSDEEKDRLRSELSKAVAMLGDYEQAREEKDMEIRRLQEELKNRDAQVGELNQLTANLATVQSQLEEQRTLEARLRQEMQGQSEEQVRLQRAYQTAVETRDSVLRERAGLQRALEEATSSVASLSDQLGRYKAIEQRLFDETQSYQSQLEALREEKSKLAKECANLAKENAAISGHQNLRQKIHYHATTKLENSRLKEEVIVLENRLRVKTTELANLQKKVTHLLTEPPTTHTPTKSSPSSSSSSFTTPSIGPHHLNNTSLLKENIVPK